ncbi:MAG: ComEC/Rec2 family competence protein [Sarcina sp.]
MKKIKYLIFLLITFPIISCISPNTKVLEIHYIDVGQGDSTLIKLNNKNILIDSGPNSAELNLKKYLKKEKIKTIDILIATHPHEDHIGNIDMILTEFKVNEIFAPYAIYSSKDFENFKKKLIENNKQINILKPNTTINFDPNINIEIFSPHQDSYSNINDYSPIMKISHLNNSFLFTGDAEEVAEREVLKANINSDVLKVGHHGSTSSSSKEFLEAVTPEISIIQCGINNDFNHPHQSTLKKLTEINSKIYRTDEDGHIILQSDGNIIKKISTK